MRKCCPRVILLRYAKRQEGETVKELRRKIEAFSPETCLILAGRIVEEKKLSVELWIDLRK